MKKEQSVQEVVVDKWIPQSKNEVGHLPHTIDKN